MAFRSKKVHWILSTFFKSAALFFKKCHKVFDALFLKKCHVKMDSSIKSLTITGSAATDAMKPRRGLGRSTSRKKRSDLEQEPEAELEPIENARRIVFGKPVPAPAPAAAPVPVPVPAPVPIPKPPITMYSPPIASPMASPAKPTPVHVESKVILNPPKNQKVKLQPKIQNKIQPKAQPLNQTRKARRVHLVNLTQRFTRAKRVRDDIQKQPMDSIRMYLIQKGVIQAKSKAPEKMLRSMYSDFMLLKDNTL